MTAEQLLYAIGNADDRYILEADAPAAKKSGTVWLKWTSLAACAVLVIALSAAVFRPFGNRYAASAPAAAAATEESCAVPEETWAAEAPMSEEKAYSDTKQTAKAPAAAEASVAASAVPEVVSADSCDLQELEYAGGRYLLLAADDPRMPLSDSPDGLSGEECLFTLEDGSRVYALDEDSARKGTVPQYLTVVGPDGSTSVYILDG